MGDAAAGREHWRRVSAEWGVVLAMPAVGVGRVFVAAVTVAAGEVASGEAGKVGTRVVMVVVLVMSTVVVVVVVGTVVGLVVRRELTLVVSMQRGLVV
jgi:hypothetical protein